MESQWHVSKDFQEVLGTSCDVICPVEVSREQNPASVDLFHTLGVDAAS